MTESSRYRRDAVTWASFGALFAFGILNAVLGPALPFLRAELGLGYVTGSLHQVAFALGGGTAGLVAASGRSSLSRRTTVVVGIVAAGLAGLGIGYGPSLVVTVTAALLVSAGATSALISVWAALSDVHHRHRAVAMTEGEVSVSLAGVGTPLLVGLLASTVWSWRSSFVVAALVAVAAAMAVRAVDMPEPVRPVTTATAAPRRLPPTLMTVFAVVAVEFALSFWLATYLVDVVDLPESHAAATVAVLYAAHLIGRFVTSRIARVVSTRRLIVLALGVVLVGSPALLGGGAVWLVVTGIAVTGAGTGALFPLASALHVESSPRSADGALGQTLTVAAVGLLLVPGFAVLAGLSSVLGWCRSPR